MSNYMRLAFNISLQYHATPACIIIAAICLLNGSGTGLVGPEVPTDLRICDGDLQHDATQCLG
eukprot:8385126-Lingulodinium_polyedra.AAC.1